MSQRHHPGIRVPLTAAVNRHPVVEEPQPVPPESRPSSAAMVRQGDVLLVPVDAIPEAAKPVARDHGRVVLAYGEATGHAHAISSAAATPAPRRHRALPAAHRRRDPPARGARGDRDRARLVPHRHPARVRARARQHARVAPGDRLMPATISEYEDSLARERQVDRTRRPPPRRGRHPRPVRGQGRAARSSGCRRRRRAWWLPRSPHRRGSGSAGPTPEATSAAALGGTGTRWPSRSISSPPGAAGSSSGSRRGLAGGRLSSTDSASLWVAIQAALSAPPLAADAMAAPNDAAEIDRGALDDLAARLLGDGWTAIVGMTGIDLARELFVATIQRTAADTLAAFATSRDARQAMQPGQFDVGTPRLAAIRDVFGDPLWRQLDEREWREVGIDARLELARSAGPWWALDGLAIVSERPSEIHLDDRGRLHGTDGPAVAWADGTEPLGMARRAGRATRDHRPRDDHRRRDRRRAEHRAASRAGRAVRRGAPGPRGRRRARPRGRDGQAVAAGDAGQRALVAPRGAGRRWSRS